VEPRRPHPRSRSSKRIRLSAPLASPRLELVALSAEFLEASLAGERRRMEALLGARVPDDWPEESNARLFLTKLREQPSWAPWMARALVLRSEQRMIGHAGFHSPPTPAYLTEYLPGGIELGYTVFARDRRRGYAREAVVALMEFARAEAPALTGFVASIAPTNQPSLALVRGLGFEKVGEYDDPEDGLEHVYALRLAPAAG
jgi:ribosomal-protein-alanine N-acetyltransferase